MVPRASRMLAVCAVSWLLWANPAARPDDVQELPTVRLTLVAQPPSPRTDPAESTGGPGAPDKGKKNPSGNKSQSEGQTSAPPTFQINVPTTAGSPGTDDKGKKNPSGNKNQPEEQTAAPEGNAGEEASAKQPHGEPWYSAHEQGTIITQAHPSFTSPYVGPHSFLPREPSATTETGTLYLDARLWHEGPEVVFNPEISGGRGLSGTMGIAGFPNGEATRVGVVEPTPYVARLFVRQTWNLGGPWERLEDAPNQIAGHQDQNRFTVSLGKMAATDFIDTNRYSHDPRTQFQNWSLMYNGAWDYPANVRGYTYGGVVEFNTVFYAIRYGIFAEPREANGAPFDPEVLKANGQILEVEQHWGLEDHPGKLHEWVFLNHAHMGNYDEAVAEKPQLPDITQTRTYRFKYGCGLNLEQELTRDLGLFIKLGWNDGHSESWAFTEIDRTAVVGLLLKGRAWHRPNDEVGLAGVVNGLSDPHRTYLAHGGLGFIIGDGRLNYGPEQILEMYYNWQIVQGINVTLDAQGANHPAYNADRGPVAIGSLRVHFEH